MDTTTAITPVTPLTKHESRKRNDRRAHYRYAARPAIDRRLDEMRLAKQLEEPI